MANEIASNAFVGILETMLTAAHVVVNSPDEFTPEIVEVAQDLLAVLSGNVGSTTAGPLVVINVSS